MAGMLLRGGMVFDGSGAAGVRADVLVEGGVIAAVGPGLPAGGASVTEVDGLVVAPGFIDLHSHSDRTIFRTPRGNSKVMQGITTEVVGNCGLGLFPVVSGHKRELEEYLASTEGGLPPGGIAWEDMEGFAAALAGLRPGVNLACLVPHGALRIAAMGMEDRPPTAAEMSVMLALLDASLRQGAWGMSSGLIYPPGSFASTDELIELARVLARRKALYCSHVRGESGQLLTAVDEAVRIAAETGVRAVVSHLKAIGRPNWGSALVALERLRTARAGGVDVWADQYPYEATATSLTALVPGWVQDGGPEAMLRRFADGDLRATILGAVRAEMLVRGGAGRVKVAALRGWANQCFVGRTMDEVAAELGLRPEEAVVRLLSEEGGAVAAIYFSLSSEDIAGIITSDFVAVGSDGEAMDPDTDGRKLVHPRSYGAFPRVLGRYVREQGLLAWEAAIRKMTGLPASILRLPDRGLLRAGYKADIVVFDRERIVDQADFTNPHRYTAGIEMVFVNGSPAVAGGRLTGDGRGEVLRR